MRAAIPLSLLLPLACSRAVPSAVPPAMVDVPAAISATSSDTSAPGWVDAAAPSTAHAVRLTDEPADKLMPSPLIAAIQPGQAPSAEHPAGTAYVVDMDPSYEAPDSVTEWDLAKARPLRRTGLPLSKDLNAAAMVRTGDRLQVVLQAWNESFAYAELTTDLRIVHVEPNVGQLNAASSITLRADDQLTAIEWTGYAKEQPRSEMPAFVLATFDHSGTRIAVRYADLGGSGPFSSVGVPWGNIAVVDGSVFVVLIHGDGAMGSTEIVRLDKQLHVQKRARVRAEPVHGVQLVVRDRRLSVVRPWGPPPNVLASFSPDLVALDVEVVPDKPGTFHFGDETVTLCRGHDMVWIGWIRGPGDPCSAPPAR